MGIDVRLPIGMMFTLLGVLIGAYGVLAPGQRSGGANGININLWWGLCLLAFGVLFLLLAVRARTRKRGRLPTAPDRDTPGGAQPGQEPDEGDARSAAVSDFRS